MGKGATPRPSGSRVSKRTPSGRASSCESRRPKIGSAELHRENHGERQHIRLDAFVSEYRQTVREARRESIIRKTMSFMGLSVGAS